MACKPVTGAVTSSVAALARRARACAARLSLRLCCCSARGVPVDGIVTARARVRVGGGRFLLGRSREPDAYVHVDASPGSLESGTAHMCA